MIAPMIFTAETVTIRAGGPVSAVVACHRCGADTGEDPADVDAAEWLTYCEPCRAVMVLPCDCGGAFERGRGPGRPPLCPDCGTICAYWDDDDLIDPDELEVPA